jgi:hypothetical protein
LYKGGVREGVREWGRNDPNIYAHMNKIKIKKIVQGFFLNDNEQRKTETI